MNDHGRPAESDRNGEFLDAEAAAHGLLQRLKKLEVEASRYLEATQRLEASTAAARDITEAIREVGRESRRFLTRIDQMEQAIRRAGEDTGSLLRRVVDLEQDVRRGFGDVEVIMKTCQKSQGDISSIIELIQANQARLEAHEVAQRTQQRILGSLVRRANFAIGLAGIVAILAVYLVISGV